MAVECRDELVGKRFLCLSSALELTAQRPRDWPWRAGVIRASSHRDPAHPELSVSDPLPSSNLDSALFSSVK